MDTLPEIEAAVDALPLTQQEKLFAERLQRQKEPKRRLPLVAPSGYLITQEDIDDALDTE